MDTLAQVPRRDRQGYVDRYLALVNENIADEFVESRNRFFLRTIFGHERVPLSNFIIEDNEIARIIGVSINEEGLLYLERRPR